MESIFSGGGSVVRVRVRDMDMDMEPPSLSHLKTYVRWARSPFPFPVSLGVLFLDAYMCSALWSRFVDRWARSTGWTT